MFTRLFNVIRGWFGLAVSDLEKRNPEALLELEAENLRKQIGSYNQGLAGHADGPSAQALFWSRPVRIAIEP